MKWKWHGILKHSRYYKIVMRRVYKKVKNAFQSMSLVDQMIDVLLSTSQKYTRNIKLNKTDAATVMTQFHTMQQLFQATPDELSMIAGLGPLKVQRLYDTFHQPFSTKLSRQRKEKKTTTTKPTKPNNGKRD